MNTYVAFWGQDHRNISNALEDLFQKPGDFEVELREGTREITLTLKDGTQLTAEVNKMVFGQ